MSRPKGSLNRSTIERMQQQNKGKNNVFVTKMERQVEGSAITRKNALGWVNFGVKNSYPTLLLDLYNQSPTHRACINFEVQSIIGQGVDLEAMKVDGSQIAPNYYQDWNTVLRAIALDYCIFGTFYLQIIMNKDRKTYSYYHIPADKVRWSEYDEDGQITSYWICNDWTEWSKNPPVEVPAFDMRENGKIEYGKPYLYCFRPYTPTMNYYCQPRYQAGIKSIQAQIEICNYDMRFTTNSFVPQGMLVMNEVADDNERQALLRNISNLFTGSDAAGGIMVSFRDNIEQKSPEFIPFQTGTGNVNLYDSTSMRVIDMIVSSHQIPSKTLIGLSQSKTGFNSEGNFLEKSYTLYNMLVGNYDRDVIVKTINFMLRMNGIEQELILKPLQLQLDYKDEESSSTDSKVDDTDVKDNDTDNIEEKVEQ